MPMIDVFAAADTFADRHQLAVDLATAVMTVEQIPDIPMFRRSTVAFAHELPADSLSNVDGDSGYVRVQVLTNAGALDRDKQLAVVEQLTRLVTAAAGDPGLANRTWVLLTEAVGWLLLPGDRPVPTLVWLVAFLGWFPVFGSAVFIANRHWRGRAGLARPALKRPGLVVAVAAVTLAALMVIALVLTAVAPLPEVPTRSPQIVDGRYVVINHGRLTSVSRQEYCVPPNDGRIGRTCPGSARNAAFGVFQ